MEKPKSSHSHLISSANFCSKETGISSSSGFKEGLDDFPTLGRPGSSTNGGNLSFTRDLVEEEPVRLDSGPKTSIEEGVSKDLVITTSFLGTEDFLKNTIGGNSNPKDWRALFPLPRAVTPQKSWKFTSPVEVNGKRVVAAHTKNLSAGLKSCEDLVVGFCVGKKVSFSAVQLAVSKLWKLKKEVSNKLYGECAYIFEFADEEDRRQALETGSFYIGSNLFTLRPWTHLIEKSIADIKSVPIWVNVFGVPLHMWNVDGLSLIGSYLGKPLLVDDYTINKTRLSYARICIEVDIDFEYPDSIPLLIDDTISFDLPVEYHWRPPKCEICNVFGHVVRNCSRKLKTRWTPKKIVFPETHFETSTEVPLGPKKFVDGFSDLNESIIVEKNLEMALPPSATEQSGDKRGKQTSAEKGNLYNKVTRNEAKHNRDINGSRINIVQSSSTVTSNANSNVGIVPPPSNDGAGAGEDNDQGEWTVAGKKNKQGNNKGGHIGVGENKNGTKIPSPAKSGVKTLTNGSGTGVFISTAANGKVQNIQSPKRNPFMVYSDFKEDSRFPINKTKEMEAKNVCTTSMVVVDRVPNSEKGLTVETEEDGDNLNDCDFEKKLQYMSLEEQILKRKQRELHRLQWNGNERNSSKGGCNSQPLGRGLRSHTKKRSS